MTDPERLADAVREACLRALIDAYEDAGVRGLCAEGRWDYAVEAVRTLELPEVLERVTKLPAA